MKFIINKNSYIELDFGCRLDQISYRHYITLTLYSADCRYILYKNVAIAFINDTEDRLRDLLNGNSLLHDSIEGNLGLLFSLYINDVADKRLVFAKKTNYPFWLGYRCILWELTRKIKPQLSTWLYEKDNKYILEIAPVYKKISSEENFNVLECPVYKEYAASYSSIECFELSKETVLQWLNQVVTLREQLEKNYERYERGYAPENGQAALDNALPLWYRDEPVAMPRERLGIEPGAYVLLQRTVEDQFHGYIRPRGRDLDQLEQLHFIGYGLNPYNIKGSCDE